MKTKGKKTLAYEHWRDTEAKPYLDKTFGHVCNVVGCDVTERLDVDHILNRSTHPDLVRSLTNVQYLCTHHHYLKTYHITELEYKTCQELKPVD